MNNREGEQNKAIIWNLFFYIKAKFGDENYQIHNKSYSINSLTVDTLKKVEYKEEEKNMEDKDKSKNNDKMKEMEYKLIQKKKKIKKKSLL